MAVKQGLPFYNDQMLTMAEHWDSFIMARSLKNPNVWHDRIPRGSYELYNGYTQKTNIFRGGLPVQAGLSTWQQIGQSRKASEGDPGFDNCAPGTPHTYKYAWETIQYTGYQDEWQSMPVCLNDMKFIDYAKDQLALIVRTGVEYGISILENWNRENYVLQAMLGNRGFVMASGALEFEDNAVYRFEYDPRLTVADVDDVQVPYITFDANLDISTLNWDFLDYIRMSLADRAGEAAIGNVGGYPVFGLMIDHMDWEKYIKSDSELRADWREAQPMKLIDSYDLSTKIYRGFSIIHDPRQMRFRVKEVNAAGKIVATRVLPLREETQAARPVTVGEGGIPVPNPAYYRAEIGIGVIFMNDVLQNLFVPSIDNLGSGMTFGPAPGLTGDWKWINILDPQTNMLGEHGFFYGRFQIFPKPLMFSFETTVFAYRRCPHALRKGCAVQSHDDAGTGAISVVADAVAGDYDEDNRRITLSLAKLLKASVGDVVTVKKADSDEFSATVVSDALAPQYTFAWKDGASNEPSAYTDFTAAVTTVTA